MFELSVNFIKHSDFANCKSSLIYFCGILGYNLDLQQWCQPAYYTQVLAALQFDIRLILLEHALPSDQRDNLMKYSPTPLERFRSIHDPYLIEEREYPFNYIHKLLNYGMEASRNSVTRSRIRWSADDENLFWDGERLNMIEWKAFILRLIDTTEDMCAKELLFRPDGTLPQVNLYSLKDNPNRKEAGHYFAMQQPMILDNGRRYVLHQLKRHNKRAEMFQVAESGLKFFKAGVDYYETMLKKFKIFLLLIMMLTCGQTGRGTELTSLLFMNTINSERSVYIEDGQIMFITSYHKSMIIMDYLKV